MWIFEKVVIHNFGILKGTHDIFLADKEVVGIRAEYEGDETRSNRAGKTTVMEAMKYVIDGSSRADKEIKLIHHGEQVMWVEGHFLNYETDERKVVKRGRDHKNNGILTLDWIEKTADAQAEINDMLGVDKDFEITNFFKQSEIHGFMEMKPTEKGALLTKWVTKGHWKTKEAKAIEDRDAIKAKLKDNELTHKALEGVMEVTEPLESQLKEIGATRASQTAEQASLTKKRQTKYVEYSSHRKDKDDAVSIIDEQNSEYDELKQELGVLNGRKEKLAKYKAFLQEHKKFDSDFNESKLEELEADLSKTDASRNQLSETLRKIQALKNPICPLLQEPCDRINLKPKEIETIKSQIINYEGTMKTLVAEIEEQERLKGLHEKYKLMKKDHATLGTMVAESKVEKDITENREKVKEYEAALAKDLTPMITEIKTIDVELKAIADKLSESAKIVGQLEHRIKTSKEALAKIDSVANRSAELRAELEDLNYVVFMFGRNGIPAHEIENAFGAVQDNINYILDGMGCDFNIDFKPDRELDKWEPVCHCGFVFPKGYRKAECEDCESPRQAQRKNEITIGVIENGEPQDFDLDSGGGKTIVSYAVRIGVTMLKREQNKSKLSVLFLDEIDSALDPYFVDHIVGSITKVLTKKLGFRQIFMVSHKSRIRDAIPDILQVTRHEDGHSTVKWQ